MKIFDIEVIENDAVPIESLPEHEQEYLKKLRAKVDSDFDSMYTHLAEEEVIHQLKAAGFDNVRAYKPLSDGPCTPRLLKWDSDGHPAGTVSVEEWEWLMQNSTMLLNVI
jgi:hypothetical protein